jgi:hypothetical protein
VLTMRRVSEATAPAQTLSATRETTRVSGWSAQAEPA